MDTFNLFSEVSAVYNIGLDLGRAAVALGRDSLVHSVHPRPSRFVQLARTQTLALGLY